MGRTDGTVERRITYDALPSQWDFHASDARFKGFSGPVGSGKSMALCQEALRLSYVNPGRMGLLGAPTLPMLREAAQVTLFEILDSNRIPYEHNKGENTLLLLDTKSRIIFRPVDEFERLRGTNLAWFGLDELTYTVEDAWLRLESRLRDPKATHLCGFAVWTPKGFDWVWRRFIAGEVKGYECIRAKPSENRHILDVTKDFYDRLKNSYDARLYAQEVLGEYLSFTGGRVYCAYDPAANLSEFGPDSKLPLLWALDFNVDPMCSIVAQQDGDVIYVFDEIFLRRSTTEEAVREFLERYPKHPAGLQIFGDASGKAAQTLGGSDYDVIKEYLAANSGYKPVMRVPDANPPVKNRINMVNRQLKNAASDIRMLINRNRCTQLLMDFEQVSYKGDTSELDKDRDRMRTHLSDALGYLVCQTCKPLPRRGPQGDQII